MAASTDKGKLMWVTGWPGCGKTTVGDYLAMECGYRHVDVDGDFMFPKTAAVKDGQQDPIVSPWIEQWGSFFKGEAPGESKFEPMLNQVCDVIAEARATDPSVNIVITQGIHRQGRDFMRKRFDDIFFVGLASDLNTKALRQLIKVRKFTEISEERSYDEAFKDRTGKELTQEAFIEDWNSQNASLIPRMLAMDVDEDEIAADGRCCNVDISEETSVLPRIRELLGMEPTDTFDVERVTEASWAKLAKYYGKQGSR